jgi:hypothetical protein
VSYRNYYHSTFQRIHIIITNIPVPIDTSNPPYCTMERIGKHLPSQRLCKKVCVLYSTDYYETFQAHSIKKYCFDTELFGPIMPVISYSNINECVEFIRDRPKPLVGDKSITYDTQQCFTHKSHRLSQGLYVFTSDSSVSEKMLHRTSSGIFDHTNTFMFQCKFCRTCFV